MSAHSSQLVKCLVENSSQQSSYRLIERDHFDLWHYLVSNKHGLKLLESSLCMWVSAEEFQDKAEIYRRAGDVEAATRVMLMVFDNTGNFANTVRFVPEQDTEQLERVLVSHIPSHHQKEGQYSIQRDPGFLVVTGPLKSLKLLEVART